MESAKRIISVIAAAGMLAVLYFGAYMPASGRQDNAASKAVAAANDVPGKDKSGAAPEQTDIDHIHDNTNSTGNAAGGIYGPSSVPDTTGPSEPVISAYPEYADGTWSNCDVRFTASGATDDVTQAKDIKYEVSLDGRDYTPGDSAFTESGQGEYTYYFRVTDGSGNSTTVTRTFKEDREKPSPPTVTMESGGGAYAEDTWVNSSVNVTFGGSSDPDSGLDCYQYKTGDGQWENGDSYTFSNSGVYTLYYRAADKAGNVTETQSKIIKTDFEAPEAFSVTAEATAIDTVSVSAATTDAQSGVAGYRVYDGSNWSDWKPSVNELLGGFSRGQSVTIKVEAKDNAGNTRIEQAKATTPKNSVPVAVNDAFTIEEDSGRTALDVLANDTDDDMGRADGETLSITGMLELSKEEAGALEFVGGVIYFTPAPEFDGAASFNYTIKDGHGGEATGFVTLMITPVNDPPVANIDFVTTDEDKEIVIDALGNDADIDSAIALKSVGSASNGEATKSGDSIVYTPAKDFNGTDVFEYTITDGQYDASATVRVTVTSVNDAPVAADDSANAYYMERITIDALANDTDVDGDALGITDVSPAQNGRVEILNGKLVYTPAESFTGTDTFTYSVSDGSAECSAAVTVAVSYPDFYNDGMAVFNTAAGTGGGDNLGSVPHSVTAVAVPPADGDVSIAGGSAYYNPAKQTKGLDAYRVLAGKEGASVEYQVITNTDAETGEAVTVGYGEPLSDKDFVSKGDSVSIDLAQRLGDRYDENAVITITAKPMDGSAEISGSVLIYRPADGFSGLDAVVLTMKAGEEQTPFAATFNVTAKQTLFSIWCAAGWAVAALLLALNWFWHRYYFAETRRRTIVYIAGSVLFFALLCWVRMFIGFLVTGLAALLYIAAACLYAEYMQRRLKAQERTY